MWELIRANKRRSVTLVIAVALVLALLGAAIGYYFMPSSAADGAFWGVLIAMVIWIVMLLASLTSGERILLATAGAKEIQKSDAPQLFNIVEEMKIASGLPAMPKVFLIDSEVPNAFAVGLKPERAAIAVTTGLMSKLNRDELQGVVAHELGHINNRDTLYITLVGVTVGAIIIIADLFLRGLWYSSLTRKRSSRSGGGQGQIIIMIAAIAFAIIAPLLAQLIYFACSRQREYLADACSAQYTRYPQGLASALEKISGEQNKSLTRSRTHAMMYIINPMAAHAKSAGLFSTHPPTEDRIAVLRGMTSDSSLKAYEEAFRNKHHGKHAVGDFTLENTESQGIREPSPESAGHDKQKNWRDAKDILHKAAGYGMLTCVCGMKMKVPPEFEERQIDCPRCGRKIEIPEELIAAAVAFDHIPEQNQKPS